MLKCDLKTKLCGKIDKKVRVSGEKERNNFIIVVGTFDFAHNSAVRDI